MAKHAPTHHHPHDHHHTEPPGLGYWWKRATWTTVLAIGIAFGLVALLRTIFQLDPLWEAQVYVATSAFLGGIGFLIGIGCFDYWGAWMKGERLDEEDHSLHGAKSWRDYFRVNTDHKVIGVQYLATVFFFFMLAGAMAMLVRAELSEPGETIANGETFNGFTSVHAVLMIFTFAVPVFAGLANYILPIMLGAKDMAFPRLNALSFWMLPVGGFLMAISLFFGAFSNGWTAYPPLAIQGETGQTLFQIGVQFAGASSIATALNFLVTIITMRAPGMTAWRMPLLVWANAVTSMLVVFATPFIAGSQFMSLFDNVMGTHFFDFTQGGDVIMYQHVFWFYSHPAVYIMLLPGFGIISEVIATFSKKPIFGYRAIAFSTVAIAVLGFGVWAHHMFVSGMAPWLRVPMMITTIIIAVPTGVKVWSWLATMWQGKIELRTPMLFALGFLFTFVIGGLSGVFLGTLPADQYLSDTYYVVAHIHYVLYGGTVMTVFAGVYYWFPKMTGKMYNEKLGKIHFWTTFIFMNATFFPMHWVGMMGMPRRVSDYDPRFTGINRFETAMSFLLGLATLIFLYNIIKSWKSGPKAPWNPWNSRTLEWQVSSPPSLFNFEQTPQVVGSPYSYGVPGARHAVVYLPQEIGGGELAEKTRMPIVVVANRSLTSGVLMDAISQRAEPGFWGFHLVVPAEAADTPAAERRLQVALAGLRDAGIQATGQVTGPDPVAAAATGLEGRDVHEIMIATGTIADSAWQRADVVDKVRKATNVAVTHVMVPSGDDRGVLPATSVRHIMLVTDHPADGADLMSAVTTKADDAPSRFTIVTPLGLPHPRWSEEASELRAAGVRRMRAGVDALRAAGVVAQGEVIDGDAGDAVRDLLPLHHPDEIVVVGSGIEQLVRSSAGSVPVTSSGVSTGAGS